MSGKYLSTFLHFVWSTAAREPWIAQQWQDSLYGVIGGALRRGKARLICAGGIEDHVHLYASMPSTETIADLVNAMKETPRVGFTKTLPPLSVLHGKRAMARLV